MAWLFTWHDFNELCHNKGSIYGQIQVCWWHQTEAFNFNAIHYDFPFVASHLPCHQLPGSLFSSCPTHFGGSPPCGSGRRCCRCWRCWASLSGRHFGTLISVITQSKSNSWRRRAESVKHPSLWNLGHCPRDDTLQIVIVEHLVDQWKAWFEDTG